MKISSASKKVLASALSAAMVVAFAPAAALAAPSATTPQGTMVTVTYEANGGTVDSGKSLAGDYAAVVADNATGHKWVKLSVAGTNAQIVKKGAAAAGWFVDTDNDGIKGDTETAVEQSGSEYWLDLTAAGLADASAVTLKANYEESTVGTMAFTPATSANVYDSDGDGSADMPAATVTVPVSATNPIAGHTYKLTVTNPDGTVVGEKTWKPDADNNATIQTANQVVYFAANPNSADKMAAYDSMLVSGKYTATLTDNGSAISTAKLSLAKVTYAEANGDVIKSAMVALGANGALDYTLDNSATWTNANGDVVSSEVISGPVTYTKASSEAAAVASALTLGSYTAGTGVDVPGSFTYAVSAVSGEGNGDKYTVSLTDPSGSVIYTAGGKTNGSVSVSFDPSAAGARTSASEQAGTYALTLSYTKDGVTTTAKKSFTLTQVKFDAGEGGSYAKNTQVSFFSTSPAAIAAADKAQANATNAVAPTVKSGYTFKEWTLNGAALGSKNALKASEVNTYTATYNTVAYAEAASWSVEKTTVGSTDYYTLTVAAPTGTKAYTSTDPNAANPTWTEYTSPVVMTKVQFNAVEAFGVKTVSTATVSKPADKVVKIKNTAKENATASDEWKTLTSGGSNKLETQVGATGTKWLAVPGVASAIAEGKTAADGLTAKYLVEQKEYNKAMSEAEKAVYEAVAAEADAQVAAYDGEALVVAGTKVYKMSASSYKTAAAAYATAKKAAEKALADTEQKTAATYQTAANAYIGAAKTFLTAANATGNVQSVKAADVTAAAAVTEQLKAAKDADAAKAALEAYSKLTDEAKKLVATADVAAAQKVVSDAETAQKLVDSQDLAAARDLNGKKVTAKAKVGKKAQGKSFTYALAASESGATASYAKVSGSKYIKISSTGKVTFSKVKVAKKAKTYKAKVSVTYGTQTVTKTVQLVVKKK